MYKNELVSVQQKRNLAKNKGCIFFKKAADYYSKNKKAIKKSQNIDIKTCQKEKKTILRSIKEKDISN